MINKIRNLLFADQTSPTQMEDNSISDADAAAVALLVEMATIDGDFGAEEHTAITKLLVAKFELDEKEVVDLIDDAEAMVNKSTDHFGFTRQVKSDYDHDQRVQLIEMLWEVVFADGIVDDFEANLVRRLSGLLHVSDRESGDAKKRVLDRLDIQEQGA